MKKDFLENFLQISSFTTIIFIAVLALLIIGMSQLKKKKYSFSNRVIIGTVVGLVLGIVLQVVAGFPEDPSSITYIAEITSWFKLIGNGYMDLIKMLVIPLVLISIIHVIINMNSEVNIKELVFRTIFVTMGMVALAAIVGLGLGVIFNIGGKPVIDEAAANAKPISTLVDTLRALIPANPVSAMVDISIPGSETFGGYYKGTNIIGLVIFASFIGIGAKNMYKRYETTVQPFYGLINALHKIIISIAMSIIKLMPYAVIPLLANTIALNGLSSILEVGKFIIVLYLGLGLMFVLQLVLLSLNGINPIHYLKKAIPVFNLAFTSRSSVGTLPLTIETLTNQLGVNQGTANFVASFGTTAGMQGCAGVFPAMLIVYVANTNGIPIDITMIIISVIVVSIGSLGIAGIPGTATMAASVSLTGTGLVQYFGSISPILAIDPLIDMGRTFVNVTGSMTNAMVVDKQLGLFDQKKYHEYTTISDDEDKN